VYFKLVLIHSAKDGIIFAINSNSNILSLRIGAIVTCITVAKCIEAPSMSVASRLSRTCKENNFPEDHRYFDADNGDDFYRNIKGLYGVLHSLEIELCNAPDTGLDETAQDSSSYQIRSVQQLYTTNAVHTQQTMYLSHNNHQRK